MTLKKGKLSIFCLPVNYPFAICATDDVIDIAENEITSVKQPEYMCAVDCLEVLWENNLRRDLVYEELHLKEKFTRRLHESYRLSMRT